MAKGFVILTNGATAEQQNTIGTSLKGMGWWHWMPQAWVVNDTSHSHNAGTLRDLIKAACPGLTFYVIEARVGEDAFAGFGPAAWNEWFPKNWVQTYPGLSGLFQSGKIPPSR